MTVGLEIYPEQLPAVQHVANYFTYLLRCYDITKMNRLNKENETIGNGMLFDDPNPKFPPKFSGCFIRRLFSYLQDIAVGGADAEVAGFAIGRCQGKTFGFTVSAEALDNTPRCSHRGSVIDPIDAVRCGGDFK